MLSIPHPRRGYIVALVACLLVGLPSPPLCGQGMRMPLPSSQRVAPPIAPDRPSDARDPEISLTPPGPDELFRVESEPAALARIRHEAEARRIQVSFPAGASPTASPPFPPRARSAAATFLTAPVCHDPLYFDDRSTERYGWHVPCVQPALSTLRFYLDFLSLPYQLVRTPPCATLCSTGLPLPGDVVPYRWHAGPAPNGLSIFYDPGYLNFTLQGWEFTP